MNKNFMNRLVILLVLALSFVGTRTLFAHDGTSPDSAPQVQAPVVDVNAVLNMSREDLNNLGPNNKAFMESLDHWRDLLKEMRSLKMKFQDAKGAEQTAIEKTYFERLEEGKRLQNELTDRAYAAFAEAPNKNFDVLNYLFGLVEWENSRENYEKAVEIFQQIEPYGIPERSQVLYAIAGCAALKCAEFDLAQKWLDIANSLPSTEKGLTVLQLFQKYGDDKQRSNAGILQQAGSLKIQWDKEKEIRRFANAETDPEKQLPLVRIETDKGPIVVELYENEAPNTVANFISLVNKGFYNNTVFHRVLPGFMAQGGDPKGNGQGGPGYTIDCECYRPDARAHFRGVLSMANSGPHTNGSQFFLTFVPTSFLNGKHTVFGRVVEGMDVLSELQRVDPEAENQGAASRIVKAEVIRARPHPYQPVKNQRR